MYHWTIAPKKICTLPCGLYAPLREHGACSDAPMRTQALNAVCPRCCSVPASSTRLRCPEASPTDQTTGGGTSTKTWPVSLFRQLIPAVVPSAASSKNGTHKRPPPGPM